MCDDPTDFRSVSMQNSTRGESTSQVAASALLLSPPLTGLSHSFSSSDTRSSTDRIAQSRPAHRRLHSDSSRWTTYSSFEKGSLHENRLRRSSLPPEGIPPPLDPIPSTSSAPIMPLPVNEPDPKCAHCMYLHRQVEKYQMDLLRYQNFSRSLEKSLEDDLSSSERGRLELKARVQVLQERLNRVIRESKNQKNSYERQIENLNCRISLLRRKLVLRFRDSRSSRDFSVESPTTLRDEGPISALQTNRSLWEEEEEESDDALEEFDVEGATLASTASVLSVSMLEGTISRAKRIYDRLTFSLDRLEPLCPSIRRRIAKKRLFRRRGRRKKKKKRRKKPRTPEEEEDFRFDPSHSDHSCSSDVPSPSSSTTTSTSEAETAHVHRSETTVGLRRVSSASGGVSSRLLDESQFARSADPALRSASTEDYDVDRRDSFFLRIPPVRYRSRRQEIEADDEEGGEREMDEDEEDDEIGSRRRMTRRRRRNYEDEEDDDEEEEGEEEEDQEERHQRVPFSIFKDSYLDQNSSQSTNLPSSSSVAPLSTPPRPPRLDSETTPTTQKALTSTCHALPPEDDDYDTDPEILPLWNPTTESDTDAHSRDTRQRPRNKRYSCPPSGHPSEAPAWDAPLRFRVMRRHELEAEMQSARSQEGEEEDRDFGEDGEEWARPQPKSGLKRVLGKFFNRSHETGDDSLVSEQGSRRKRSGRRRDRRDRTRTRRNKQKKTDRRDHHK